MRSQRRHRTHVAMPLLCVAVALWTSSAPTFASEGFGPGIVVLGIGALIAAPAVIVAILWLRRRAKSEAAHDVFNRVE